MTYTNVDHVDRTLVAVVISDTLLRYASLMYVKLAIYQAWSEEGENTIIWISKTSIWFLCKEYMYVIQKMLSIPDMVSIIYQYELQWDRGLQY